jgi:hypothetical protein
MTEGLQINVTVQGHEADLARLGKTADEVAATTFEALGCDPEQDSCTAHVNVEPESAVVGVGVPPAPQLPVPPEEITNPAIVHDNVLQEP